jgi:methanethiol oxidase
MDGLDHAFDALLRWPVTQARLAGGNAPGGVFLMDHETFDVRGQWEMDRGPQQLAYDAWWHLGYDTMVTSEWGTPTTFENGLIPEMLLKSQ